MNRIAILGAGRVGEAIAWELSADYEVALADRDANRLDALGAKLKVPTAIADLSDPSAIRDTVAGFDMVIGAVPGFMGYEMTKEVILAGKPLVDISFFEEDPFMLNDLAIDKGVPVVVDAGIAPGFFNMVVGHEDAVMKVDEVVCYVGGLPADPQPPWYYKAPYSPIDVIEFYTRPARIVENGKLVVKEALSELESIELELGMLEAFNSDGLRTLITTMPHIPNMKEKTFRWPKHVEYVKVVRDSGFFSKEAVDTGGESVRPIDLNSKILFDQWFLKDSDDEFTIMRVVVKGDKGTVTYDIFDKRNKKTGLSSMSRTTGFTCAALARLVAEGRIKEPGVQAPEQVAQHAEHFDFVLQRLVDHGVMIDRTVS